MDDCVISASFDPVANPCAFRNALGRFATGVTVVTARGESGPIGITANSFSSLSLTPPLVLWSPAKASRRHDVFVRADHFAINVLAAHQHSLSDHFAVKANGFEKFDVSISEHGLPVLMGCAAVFECQLVATHDGGDHTIIIGRVRRAHSNSGATLLFHDGQMAPSTARSCAHSARTS
jgi:flavin reductase (DIM6/NTAB) family NADH-FMN oxidoreductase RutF